MFEIRGTNAESHSELAATLISHDYFFWKTWQNELTYVGQNVMQILIFSPQYKLKCGLLVQSSIYR